MILGYARVSTDDQARNTSPEDQQRKNRAIATLLGAGQFDFVTYTDTAVSGAVPLNKRPLGSKMLEEAHKGDTIVAQKMDRLFRSTLDALQTSEALKKRGIDLILADISTDPITGNGVGKLFFSIMAAVAEFERERIADRVQDGKDAKRRAGGHIGGSVPYGYRKVGSGREARLEPDEAEQKVILEVHRHYRVPSLRHNLNKLAGQINQMGFVSRSGKPFQRTQVMKILEREPVSG